MLKMIVILLPNLAVVPMGWTHALDLAQHYFEELVSTALKVPVEGFLRDGVVARDVGMGAPAVYVDNFLYASEEQVDACTAFGKVKAEGKRRGLPMGVDRAGTAGWWSPTSPQLLWCLPAWSGPTRHRVPSTC